MLVSTCISLHDVGSQISSSWSRWNGTSCWSQGWCNPTQICWRGLWRWRIFFCTPARTWWEGDWSRWQRQVAFRLRMYATSHLIKLCQCRERCIISMRRRWDERLKLYIERLRDVDRYADRSARKYHPIRDGEQGRSGRVPLLQAMLRRVSSQGLYDGHDKKALLNIRWFCQHLAITV